MGELSREEIEGAWAQVRDAQEHGEDFTAIPVTTMLKLLPQPPNGKEVVPNTERMAIQSSRPRAPHVAQPSQDTEPVGADTPTATNCDPRNHVRVDQRKPLHAAPEGAGKDADLQKKIKEARAIYDAMTPEQKMEHDRKQRESWVRGEMGLGLENGPVRAASTPPASEGAGKDEGEKLEQELLAIIRRCHIDGINSLELNMDGVVLDGEDTGTWHLTLQHTKPSPTNPVGEERGELRSLREYVALRDGWADPELYNFETEFAKTVAERDSLQSEVTRLRVALKTILKESRNIKIPRGAHRYSRTGEREALNEIEKEARAALEGK